LELSRLTRWARSKVSRSMIAGTGIGIHSSLGRSAVARLAVALAAARLGRLEVLAAVVVDGADVGLVAQQPLQRRGAPHRLAGRGGNLALVEVEGDLANRAALLHIGAEDPAHHVRLGLVDLHPRRLSRLDDAAVAVGDLPEEDLALACAVELAAPVALGDLGPLVFGDHPLHLHQQRRLRVVARRGPLEEADPGPEAPELLEDQHLVGVGAGEAIGREADDALEQARLGGVAQAVERGPIEPGAGVALVDELLDDLVPVGASRLAQELELRGDRAALLLALGRDTCVERDPHQPTAWTLRSGARGGRSRNS
jgi:hypothetical protein